VEEEEEEEAEDMEAEEEEDAQEEEDRAEEDMEVDAGYVLKLCHVWLICNLFGNKITFFMSIIQ
jgi:Mg/Co/Ni transporter MgtE